MAYTIANEIRIGNQNNPTYRWDNAKIIINSPKGVFSVDILGNELSIDTFTSTVWTNIDAPLAYNPAGSQDVYKTSGGGIYLLKKPANYGQNFLTDIAPSTPVYWYVGGSVFAKGYFQKVERIARNMYKLTCSSGIGLLNAKTHLGGLYSGTTANTILSSIIGNTFAYSVSNDVKDVAVYGHLPFDTARNNLHRLLFALGAVLLRDANGNYVVSFLSNSMVNIPQSRVALGGRTQYVTPCDSVEITEHSFFALYSDEVVSLFDNSNGASVSGLTVIFDAPMHDLSTTGNLTISESSVNHAVVSGVGTLTGKKYTHNMLIQRMGTGSQNVKRVTDNELVSFANSYYVASRVYSYFKSTRTLNAKVLLENEKPGQLVSITDSFGDATNAFLASMEVAVTSLKVAMCKLISGFVPGSNGNNFNNRVLLTANTTWIVPSGVTRIRIVLIGGATGGQGGYDGTDGDNDLSFNEIKNQFVSRLDMIWQYAYENNEQTNGVGGLGGAAGEKASFLVSDQVVQQNDAVVVAVGVGGAGGARNGGLGSAGTPSTAQCSRFGTLSSADGLSTYEGYNDPVSGITFAVDGDDGYKGGDGGLAGEYGYGNGERGEAVQTYGGGAPGSEAVGGWGIWDATHTLYDYRAGGGGSGGAAYGNVGGNATAGRRFQEIAANHTREVIQGGNGGNGANAVAPAKPTIYGKGGAGGHGGGGGGNAGGAYLHSMDGLEDAFERVAYGSKGTGGQGSAGSKGGDGCCIIYY